MKKTLLFLAFLAMFLLSGCLGINFIRQQAPPADSLANLDDIKAMFFLNDVNLREIQVTDLSTLEGQVKPYRIEGIDELIKVKLSRPSTDYIVEQFILGKQEILQPVERNSMDNVGDTFYFDIDGEVWLVPANLPAGKLVDYGKFMTYGKLLYRKDYVRAKILLPKDYNFKTGSERSPSIKLSEFNDLVKSTKMVGYLIPIGPAASWYLYMGGPKPNYEIWDYDIKHKTFLVWIQNTDDPKYQGRCFITDYPSSGYSTDTKIDPLKDGVMGQSCDQLNPSFISG